MTDAIDTRLRHNNPVHEDHLELPPIEPLLQRLEHPRGPLRRRWHHPLATVAIALTLTGTATATVVAVNTGPSSALDANATPDAPAVGRITALMDRFDRHWRDHSDGRAPHLAGLGAGGPVTGTTIRRDGFDIQVASDTKTICFTAEQIGRPVSGLQCAPLPIPFDMVPFATTRNSDQPALNLFYAIAPDGVTDFSVTVKDGRTRHTRFIDNIATISLDGNARPTSWSWTTPDGRRITQEPGGKTRTEPGG